jgi:hypothetical protein
MKSVRPLCCVSKATSVAWMLPLSLLETVLYIIILGCLHLWCGATTSVLCVRYVRVKSKAIDRKRVMGARLAQAEKHSLSTRVYKEQIHFCQANYRNGTIVVIGLIEQIDTKK